MKEKENNMPQRVKNNKMVKLLITFAKSAAVGLLFAVLCFAYDVYHDSEQDKQLEKSIDKLEKIEQGLSTRYLGIFPNYIDDIGSLFGDLNPKDTVVIFEDVLYYGIKSKPKEFYYLNAKLIGHAMQKGPITIAYYGHVNNGLKPDWTNIFHKMIIESRIDAKYHEILNKNRDEEIRKIRRDDNKDENRIKTLHHQIDSTLCEKYFSATRVDNMEKFKADVDAYLKKDLVNDSLANLSSAAERLTYQMCVEIDSVKQLYLGQKAIESIRFYDYEQMYRSISEIMAQYYSKVGIDLIPLNEYLTMSCWMVKKGNSKDVKTVLAFPSKYSTDEIGFYSQDEAFSRYIGTMLEGVRQNQHWGNDNNLQ